MSSVIDGVKILIIPPGGWWYSQPVDSGTPFRVEAQTYQKLLDSVLQFRLQNIEIVPGGSATRESVQDDVREFICSRYPDQCCGPAPPRRVAETKADTVEYLPPITRMEHWFKRLAGAELSWNSPSKASENAKICATCPKNIAWEVSHCPACVTAATRRILKYKGDRATPSDDKLRACRCFGFHTALGVWLQNPLAVAKEPPPDACWNK